MYVFFMCGGKIDQKKYIYISLKPVNVIYTSIYTVYILSLLVCGQRRGIGL